MTIRLLGLIYNTALQVDILLLLLLDFIVSHINFLTEKYLSKYLQFNAMKRISLIYEWLANGPGLKSFEYRLNVYSSQSEIIHSSYSQILKKSQRKNETPALALAMNYLRAHPYEIFKVHDNMTERDTELTEKLKHALERIVEIHNYATQTPQK